jgi:mRNA-degrading endonuclease toxin of MazEF toxin-antitoxin module
MNIKRGDICLAALDQVIRKEISKTRPQITAKKIIASTPASRSCKVKVGRGEFPLDIIPTFGYDGI